MIKITAAVWAAGLLSLSLLTGCTGLPGLTGAPARSARSVARLPSGSGDALVYYFVYGNRYQGGIYDYTRRQNLGTFGFPTVYTHNLCADGSGDVFVTGTNGSISEVAEYPYGATSPSSSVTFSDTHAGACAVDANGDVAVVSNGGQDYHENFVAVFTKFQEPPAIYRLHSKNRSYRSMAYDPSGNLFVLGTNFYSSKQYYLMELSAGARRWKALTPNASLTGASSVAWDGQYLAVTIEQTASAASKLLVDRFSVAGSGAKLVHTSTFRGPGHFWGSWISGKTGILAASTVDDRMRHRYGIGFWSYPDGGKALFEAHEPKELITELTIAAP